ncbi:MAG TPA: sulfatase [Candidatus Polarisedimenticolia bacterium]|nr:sulfatase [Candidatus Polarisedimenticolia bacterium]
MSPSGQAAGEGALAGWAMGSILAGWAIYLSRDLPHGMYRLAVERWIPPALTGALVGAAVSFLVAMLLSGLARTGRRWLFGGITILALCYGVALVLAAGPLRPLLFPLRIFSGKALSIGMFMGLAGALGALLLARFRQAHRGGPDRTGDVRGIPGRVAFAAWFGAALGILTASFAVTLPLTPTRGPTKGLPVILVSLDTLRADRLGVLGNTRGLTPNLDALARDGTGFDRAESAAPWTLPSHASLFTSLLPYDHGARWDHRPLRPGVATLAEHFREAGYRTASFNGGGYVSAALGLGQGFELYEEHDEVREAGPERIAAASLEWVRSVGDDPFFLFIHTYEVHTPYAHHDRADPGDAGRLARTFEFKDVAAVQGGRLTLTAGERRYVTGLYDSDVAFADRVIGGLLETLRKDGILDRAILVVLSDHGEDLWDHSDLRSPGHGHSLYEELLRVPLFFRAPGLVRAGALIRTPVSLLDVAPTLLALTGLSPDPDHQGRSLERTLRDGLEPTEVPIHAESIEYGPGRFALRQGDLKVILTPMPDQVNAGVGFPVEPVEIFDLRADPREEHALSVSIPPGAAVEMENLWRRVHRVFEPLRDRQIGDDELPERLREQLRSLGYVQ